MSDMSLTKLLCDAGRDYDANRRRNKSRHWAAETMPDIPEAVAEGQPYRTKQFGRTSAQRVLRCAGNSLAQWVSLSLGAAVLPFDLHRSGRLPNWY